MKIINKKQIIAAIFTTAFILLVLMLNPTIDFPRPETEKQKNEIIETKEIVDRIFIVYLPAVILLFGGIWFYKVRNKN